MRRASVLIPKTLFCPRLSDIQCQIEVGSDITFIIEYAICPDTPEVLVIGSRELRPDYYKRKPKNGSVRETDVQEIINTVKDV